MICTPHRKLFTLSNQEQVRSVGHVAHKGEKGAECQLLVGKLRERGYLEHLDLKGKIH